MAHISHSPRVGRAWFEWPARGIAASLDNIVHFSIVFLTAKTVLSKFVSVLLEKENELSRCVCQKHMQLIHKYENLKLNCKDEILLVPKFEMDSTEKTAQQLKESLNLITSQFEMKEQSMSAKVQSLQQTISMYEQKQEELSGLLKLQIEENKLIQKSLE